MEAILLLFIGLAEAILFLATAFIPMVGSLIMVVIEGVLCLGSSSSGNRRSGPSSRTPDKKHQDPHLKTFKAEGYAKWRKVAFQVLVPLSCLGLIAIILIETVLFQPTVNWVAKIQENKTSVSVSFAQVEGSFITRRFAFEDLLVRKVGSESGVDLDLKVDRVEGDFKGFLVSIPNGMDKLQINGLKGQIKVPDKEKEKGIDLMEFAEDWLSRSFVIDVLEVNGCELEILLPEEEIPRSLMITEWTSNPIRYRLFGFDLLFRSNIEGSLDDIMFSIASKEIKDGRQSQWQAENIDLALMTSLLGAPWNLFSQGTIDVLVNDEWFLSEDAHLIDMDWLITMKSVELDSEAISENLTPMMQSGFTHYMNSRIKDKNLDLGFTMRIQDGEFEGTVTHALGQIWESAFIAWANEKLSMSSKQSEELKETTKQVGGWLKQKWEDTKQEQ